MEEMENQNLHTGLQDMQPLIDSFSNQPDIEKEESSDSESSEELLIDRQNLLATGGKSNSSFYFLRYYLTISIWIKRLKECLSLNDFICFDRKNKR